MSDYAIVYDSNTKDYMVISRDEYNYDLWFVEARGLPKSHAEALANGLSA